MPLHDGRPQLGERDRAPGGLVLASDGTWYRGYRPEVVRAGARADTDRWLVEHRTFDERVRHRILTGQRDERLLGLAP